MTDRPAPADVARPLAGRSVMVTRAAEQASGLASLLEDLGARVVMMPVIQVVEPQDWSAADEAILRLDSYDWVVLTSVNGVDAFEARLARHGRSLADLAGTRVAAVGSATARHLAERGVTPEIVPAEFRAEGLVDDLLATESREGARVLIPRAAEAREVLPDELRAHGFAVDVVPVYRVVAASPDPEALASLGRGEVDAVVFASGGTARRFADVVAAAGLDARMVLAGTVLASIGPVTSDALRELGLHVEVEAAEATSTSLAAALARHFEAAAR